MKKVLYLFIIIPLLSLANDKNSLSIGETLPIPNYKMKSVDGSFYSLNDLKTEEGILVIFTCNTCPFVVMWEDRYKMLEEYCKKTILEWLILIPITKEETVLIHIKV